MQKSVNFSKCISHTVQMQNMIFFSRKIALNGQKVRACKKRKKSALRRRTAALNIHL